MITFFVLLLFMATVFDTVAVFTLLIEYTRTKEIDYFYIAGIFTVFDVILLIFLNYFAFGV